MTDIILDEYHRAPGAACSAMPLYAANTVTEQQQQPSNLGPQPVNDQQVSVSDGEPINPAERPVHDVHPDLESTGSTVPGQETVGDEQGPGVALLTRSKVTTVQAAGLLVASLSLIVTPGVVLGVVTEEAMMGIALSGAITTVIGTFAGFYYFHSKNV